MGMRVATAFFEDNRFFFLCLVGAELICYFSLCWFKLASGAEADKQLKLILRPYSFAFLMLSLLLVVLGFKLAGSDFTTINFAKSNDSIKSLWLCFGISVAQFYLFGSLALCVLETLKEIKRRRYATQPKFKYRFHSFALVMAAAGLYIAIGLVGSALYWLSGSEGWSTAAFKVRDSFSIIFLLMAFCLHVFFNWKIVLLLDWLYQRNLLRMAKKLQWFYELTIKTFPANYRFNAYAVYAESRKSGGNNSPRWLLNTVLLGFSDVDWNINHTEHFVSNEYSSKVKSAIQITREAEKWYHYFLYEPGNNYSENNPQAAIPVTLGFKPPKFEEGNRLEEAAHYYIKLGEHVRNLTESFDTKINRAEAKSGLTNL
jgi:hypothetical protein